MYYVIDNENTMICVLIEITYLEGTSDPPRLRVVAYVTPYMICMLSTFYSGITLKIVYTNRLICSIIILLTNLIVSIKFTDLLHHMTFKEIIGIKNRKPFLKSS